LNDGKSLEPEESKKNTATSSTSPFGGYVDVSRLSEEEMMALALEASRREAGIIEVSDDDDDNDEDDQSIEDMDTDEGMF
jgi:hypothetical protein